MSEHANGGRPPLPPLPKKQNLNRQFFGGAHASKGIGPNKACGHKGGIRRQGSKRG